MVVQQIQEKGLHIIENYTGDSTNFYTDRKLINMILQNLITNAVKYSLSDGEVSIHIAISNEKLEIVIGDTGMGIPKDEQSKIFTKTIKSRKKLLSYATKKIQRHR